MAADDFSNDPNQGFPGDVDTSSSFSGNRPASGARRATPGEVLSQGFSGAQNAGDFLGLDVEFTGSQDPAGHAGTPLDLVPPPGIYSPDAGDPAAYVPEPAPLPQGDAAQEFAQAPSAFEFGEDLGSDDGVPLLAEESGPSRSRLLVPAVIVFALVGAGVFYGPSLYSRFMGPSIEVAEVSKPAPKVPKPALETTREPEGATLPAPVPDVVASPDELPFTEPDASPLTPSFDPLQTPAPRPTIASGASDPEVEPLDLGSELPAIVGSGVRPVEPAFPDLTGAEYEWASEDRLELIWRGTEVPLEAVRAPARTLMPRVGNVRVFTTAGDAFDGKLYAVGQNRVWIDAQPGRIGLDGQQVQRIEVLPPLPEGVNLAADELGAAGGKRVRVRVPGGMLFGRVLKIEGDSVLLAMDQGGRVSVHSADIEELGSGRAVVVRR